MAKTVRSAVSIPIELKARMDAVEESINWSSLACQAFEEKLVEIAKKKVEMDRAEVIARLRASKRKVASRLYDAGFAAGEKWAKAEAGAHELRNLAKFRSSFTCDGRRDLEDFFDPDDDGEPGHAGWAKAIACRALGMAPDDYDDEIATKHAYEMFSREVHVMDKSDYVYGFLEGALAVWDQVANDI